MTSEMKTFRYLNQDYANTHALYKLRLNFQSQEI